MNIMEHLPILVVVTMFTGAYITPLVGMWKKSLCYPIALASSSLASFFSVSMLIRVMEHGVIRYAAGAWEPPWGIELVVDPLSAFMTVIISSVGFLAVMFSKEYIKHDMHDDKQPAYYALMQLVLGGMLGALVTGDLFNLFVMTEIYSISAYALVAIAQKKGSLLASYRYLVLGSIGTTFILFAISFLFMMTGTLNMADLSQRLPLLESPWVISSGLILLIVGYGVKSALFPLHSWLPDAHAIASSPVSVVLSALVIKVGAYSIIRSVFTVFGPQMLEQSEVVTSPITWMSSMAILFGSIYAISQTDIKRMLAYSSIAHMGYILLGIGLASSEAMTGSIFHILNHAMAKACLFFCAGAVIYKTGIRSIEGYAGMGSRMPITMAAFTLAATSLMGIPPTSGFMSKFYLGIGAYQGNWVFLAVILLGSLLSAIYFFRVIWLVYFSQAEPLEVVLEHGPSNGKSMPAESAASNNFTSLTTKNVDTAIFAASTAAADFNGLVPHEKIKLELPLTMLIPIMLLSVASMFLGIMEHIPVYIVERAVMVLIGQ